MYFRLSILLLVSANLAILQGCSHQAIEAADSTAIDSPEQSSLLAIDAAHEANLKARAVRYEWRDTAVLIEKARQAHGAGRYQQAIQLAGEARRQGENAYLQYQRAQQQFMTR